MRTDAAPQLAASRADARLVPLQPGLYAFALAGNTGPAGNGGEPASPAVQVCAPPGDRGGLKIVGGAGRLKTWLRPDTLLVVRSPPSGGAALVTLYAMPETGGRLPVVQVRRLDRPEPPLILTFGDSAAAIRPAPRPISLEIVAHLSGRGGVRLIDAPWIGGLDPDALIESFTLLPREPALLGAIEYKGLPASGAETPWLPGGVPCGTAGGGIALLGFAVRQKPAAAPGLRLACEYSGRFRSGAVSGPARNGAPCLSPAEGDPLCAMQLRIAAHPVR